MNVLLLHIDGKIPNIALMRLAAHHRDRGDPVELRYATTPEKVRPQFWDAFDRVYASAIFERSRPIVRRLLEVRPDAIVGGTGWDERISLESIGVETGRQDYSDYPKWRQSIGFLMRGCRYECSFCKVPTAEGKPFKVANVRNLWRGDPWPRELIVMDNDFFAPENDWRTEIEAMKRGKFKVSFNQGINARALTDEAAAAIASVDYRDDQMKTRRIYTAWDSKGDERKLFRGLDALVRHGVKPPDIMVYILIGYDHGAEQSRPCLTSDDHYRRERLREFGARPYPMPFIRTPELVGFQRWCIGGYDKRVRWDEWRRARYQPVNVQRDEPLPLFDGGRS